MKTLTILFLTLNCFFMIAQTEPRILILSPTAHTFHKVPGKELKERTDDYRKQLNLNEADQYLQSPEFNKQPEHIRVMQQSEVAFLKQLDEVKIVSYLLEQHLAYFLLEKMKAPVVELKDRVVSGEIADFERIAVEEKAAFIINISSFDLMYEKGKNSAELTIQLFDSATGMISERTSVGDELNPGFEYACEEGSVNCCINNALSSIVPQAAKWILSNDPGVKKQQQLEKIQNETLKTMLDAKQEANALSGIIPSTDKKIDQENVYRVLFDKDHTKFVAFFAETVPAGEGKTFRDKHKEDRNVNIVSDNQTGFFSGALPNTYAYIVRGVIYNGKWYYEKSDVTYFDAATLKEGKTTYFYYLRKWGFFLEGTPTPDPAFWEGAETQGYTMQTKVMFAKVPVSDPNHGGMYRVIADQLEEGK